MRVVVLTLVAFSLVFSTSCRKRKENRSTTTSQDQAAAEAGFDDVFKVTESAIKDNDLEKSGNAFASIYGNCATVSINPPLPDTTFPKTITIDFGSTNCEDSYGVNRRGQIIAVITGKYRDAGTSITITPQDYYLNDNKIEGTKTVQNIGPNSDGNTEFTVEISNATVTYPDGDFTTYESSRVREWVVGESTDGLLGILDDEYDITGTASGTDRTGRDYEMTITSPLRVAVLCRWVKQGTVEIQPEDLYLRTVDFGNGDCDATVNVEINGNNYTFIMN
ncbi:hypothetical protein [Parvicella tangerina]|uniref:Lipoprotein n=1 Tax=Parvicella tangerina TaxID=2829795 RepID=A0A916JLS1_9FLAO|nr:hypothetical protein [Parvicella tangerina]CAG5080327.1 hypothetical protein CRYO30217_01259 [Parvicella tangerina]